MICVPRDFKPLLNDFASAVRRQATARRLVFFFAATIVVVGRRTVSASVRLLSLIHPVNPSTFHRLFSHRRWSSFHVSRALAGFVVNRFAPDGVIRLVGDETVDEHRGKKVYGKARHRDSVRSANSYVAFRFGHKWIVLAILVELPYYSRPLALPLLVALYRDPKTNAREKLRHRTPSQLMRGLLATLMHWFPEKRFVFAGDNEYGNHDLSRFAHRHSQRLTLVSKIVANANFYELPPKKRKKTVGRRPKKGKKMPSPEQVVAKRRRGKKLRVRWYGGQWRNVEVITGKGNWFKSGKGLVPILWVFVRDLDSTHRDEYFFTTDQSMSATDVIEMYGGRWNIETTFQEVREHLGLESTRGWSKSTVLRMAPSLFLLYTVVVVFYDTMPQSSTHLRERSWAGKEWITFGDAITSVRHYLWMEWIFEQTPGGASVRKLPRPVRRLLDFGLVQAA